MQTSVIKKWYQMLKFPEKFDQEFYNGLKNFKFDDTVSFANYNLDEQDGKKNLFYFLYFCEKLQADYDRAGMSRVILMDTLSDIVKWTENWSAVKGELYLGELCFLQYHFKMELFKIGRLEYFPKKSPCDIPTIGVKTGDTVLTIHIPQGEKLLYSECEKSVRMARDFYARYFPALDYKCFLCCSWLLDQSLKDVLPPESNILQFQNLFTIISQEKSDAIIPFVFRWDATRAEIGKFPAKSAFAERVKRCVLAGKDFYKGIGYVEKF